MIILRLALQSLFARRLTVLLTIFAIALSVALFLGVEKVRIGAKTNFSDTISGTDLIVGARSGSVQLLLYSIFGIGNPTNNVTWESFQDIHSQSEVKWAVPISLGDSHRQFRVLGTTPEFFEHYKFRGGRSLAFQSGSGLNDLFDTVLGSEVARSLGHTVGDEIIISHGLASFSHHDDLPFTVTGILGRTGTPVDRTVIIGLDGMEAVHVGWRTGAPGETPPLDQLRSMNLVPENISAALIGTNSPLEIFQLQRRINEYPLEPLLAIIPGVALQELWSVVGIAETALTMVAGMIVVTALLGMLAMILSSLNERRREMAILRSMGAGPLAIAVLLITEAAIISISSVAIGIATVTFGLMLGQSSLDRATGLFLEFDALTLTEVRVLCAVVGISMVIAIIPAWRAYRLSISDGMSIRT